MMLIHSPPGFCSDFYVSKCVRTHRVACASPKRYALRVPLVSPSFRYLLGLWGDRESGLEVVICAGSPHLRLRTTLFDRFSIRPGKAEFLSLGAWSGWLEQVHQILPCAFRALRNIATCCPKTVRAGNLREP